MNTIQTFKEKKGKRILKIYQDEDSVNPREDNDNLGKMVCFHSKYALGDNQDIKREDFDSWEDLNKFLIKEKKAVLISPLYLYDHSGLRIKIGNFAGLLPQGHAHFDSGQVGFVYTTKEDIKNWGTTKKKAEKILKEEAKIYDQYLAGDIFRYEVFKEKTCKTCKHCEEEFIDSCSGFYGIDEKEIFDNAGLKQKDFEEVTQ